MERSAFLSLPYRQGEGEMGEEGKVKAETKSGERTLRQRSTATSTSTYR